MRDVQRRLSRVAARLLELGPILQGTLGPGQARGIGNELVELAALVTSIANRVDVVCDDAAALWSECSDCHGRGVRLDDASELELCACVRESIAELQLLQAGGQ